MSSFEDVALNPSGTVDFAGLILGFSSAALYYLGVTEVAGRAPVRNLPLARQNIDIIKMLQEKTQGNLTAEEASLIQQLLTDLQVKMVESSK